MKPRGLDAKRLANRKRARSPMKRVQLLSHDGTTLIATVEIERNQSPVVIIHGTGAFIRMNGGSAYRATSVVYQPVVLEKAEAK